MAISLVTLHTADNFFFDSYICCFRSGSNFPHLYSILLQLTEDLLCQTPLGGRVPPPVVASPRSLGNRIGYCDQELAAFGQQDWLWFMHGKGDQHSGRNMWRGPTPHISGVQGYKEREVRVSYQPRGPPCLLM